MNEQQLSELALNSGPIGTLVVALGFMIRGWVNRLEGKVDAIAKAQTDDAVVDARTSAKVEEHERRIAALEQRKVGA